jgi:hypothetical protein
LTLTGLASVAAIALAWSAFAADGEKNQGNDNGESQRWELPAPPPGGGEGGDRLFRFHGPPPGVEGADGEAVPGPPPPHRGPGGPLGPNGGELTWGELHVQRDGEAVTLRVDHGEVAAVDSDSILVTENDGNDVEIPVDEETEVMAGPFADGETTVEDLEEGDTVHVVREEGEAAERIGVLPDPEELERHFEQMAPSRGGSGQSG